MSGRGKGKLEVAVAVAAAAAAAAGSVYNSRDVLRVPTQVR